MKILSLACLNLGCRLLKKTSEFLITVSKSLIVLLQFFPHNLHSTASSNKSYLNKEFDNVTNLMQNISNKCNNFHIQFRLHRASLQTGITFSLMTSCRACRELSYRTEDSVAFPMGS